MWISGGWKDYELLDCGDGERLERWGSYILVRPDPQAIGEKPRSPSGSPDARYFRSDRGGGTGKSAICRRAGKLGTASFCST